MYVCMYLSIYLCTYAHTHDLSPEAPKPKQRCTEARLGFEEQPRGSCLFFRARALGFRVPGTFLWGEGFWGFGLLGFMVFGFGAKVVFAWP